MKESESQPAVQNPKHRCFHVMPGHCLAALLAVEGLLFLGEQFCGPPKGWAVLIAVASVGVVMLSMFAWFAVALLFHRRFRFSVRSLLVMVVVVALPFSWLAVKMQEAKEQSEAVQVIVASGGYVFFDYQFEHEGAGPSTEPPGPALLREFLRDEFFTNPVSASVKTDDNVRFIARLPYLQRLSFYAKEAGDRSLTDVGLEGLKELHEIRILNLSRTRITDAGLKHIKELPALSALDLSHTATKDKGLEELEGLHTLRSLDLEATHITDNGLTHLKALQELKELNLRGTDVTDAGLEHLATMHELRGLDVGNTKVSYEGVKRLRKVLPNCWIIR